MEIINLIFFIWATLVGILIVFTICDRIVWHRPKTKFARWWRNNIVTHTYRDN
jgi:hypothetical protein